MIQESPTYMAYNAKLGAWAFSPSYITGADIVYDVSHWTWENIQAFMVHIRESDKIDFLEANGVQIAKTPMKSGDYEES
ncbi:hypothetical protein UFOVP587_33 [uncultured Caudovirales phage]|uniref:Uncharacterized protein n=1 Tax=uncultured Caudovirales phage TaxID=2100421 RepID=A0A6J5N343_9CAUD|nr:hypothetical protein UFOVP587_33 [uncultured Caudovirales phage]